MTYSDTNYRMSQASYQRHIEEQQRAAAMASGYAGINFKGSSRYSPAVPADHWSTILGVSQSATAAEIKTAYRKFARSAHPDAGGSAAVMAKLNAARDAALKEVTP